MFAEMKFILRVSLTAHAPLRRTTTRKGVAREVFTSVVFRCSRLGNLLEDRDFAAEGAPRSNVYQDSTVN
jgi:hypothetical protein